MCQLKQLYHNFQIKVCVCINLLQNLALIIIDVKLLAINIVDTHWLFSLLSLKQFCLLPCILLFVVLFEFQYLKILNTVMPWLEVILSSQALFKKFTFLQNQCNIVTFYWTYWDWNRTWFDTSNFHGHSYIKNYNATLSSFERVFFSMTYSICFVYVTEFVWNKRVCNEVSNFFKKKNPIYII